MTILIWIGITFCITQSAMFSGLNLAFFSVSKLRLEVEVSAGNRRAKLISKIRKDSNFLLSTILWGNVGINVLLTLFSNSVLAGVAAFLFSTILITFLGEIIPQAYFSRHAITMGAILSPAIRIYQILLYVVAKPTALLLDALIGPEAIQFFDESDLREVIKLHVDESSTDIAKTEGIGALNFLAIDDLAAAKEGEKIDPTSIINLAFEGEKPLFPSIRRAVDDEFLNLLNASGKKWAVLVDSDAEPRMIVNIDGLVRETLFGHGELNPHRYCHHPIIVREPEATLGNLLHRLRVSPEHAEDDVIDVDAVIIWTEKTRKIITGSDIFGRLMRGISSTDGGRPK